MKITFTLPGIGISGGTKAVFEFANHLHDRCHDVSVVFPLIPMRSGAKLYNIRNLLSRAKGATRMIMWNTNIDWFNLKANLKRVPTLAERYLHDADIVVATWWATAYYVSKYNNSKGKKFYLAQHYETWGGPEREVNNSYKLGLRIIVNSTWLKNILKDKLNEEAEALILHAPDLEQFYPESRDRTNNTIRILMPYRYKKWKGVKDGIRAFEIIKKKCHQAVKLVMFGPPPRRDALPPYVEFHTLPVKDILRKLYNSCDIFMFPSHHEGFGMPPMEAMACNCAVATTNVGAVSDYSVPGETALVSPPNAPELLAENIVKLVKNDDLRKHISEAGHNYIIKNFSWNKATDALEKLFSKE